MARLKPILFAGILVVIVLAVAALAYSKFKVNPDAAETVNKSDAPAVKVTDVPADKFPDKFPQDVPIEQGASVAKNFNADGEAGFQATRTFESQKSLADNYAVYDKYLKASGWEISTTVDQPQFKLLVGSKSEGQLRVELSGNSVTNKNTVNITYFEHK